MFVVTRLLIAVPSPPPSRIAQLQSLEALEAAHEEAQIDLLFRQFRCTSVYLDVGTSVGTQIRKLYEPELFPGASVLRHFSRLFGRARCGVCAIVFAAAAPIALEVRLGARR